jgi:glycerol uptake facilitator protein
MYELAAELMAEFIGTAILILLGNGVVANVLLTDTKGNGSGWIVICAGWGLAVYTAVLCVGEISGAHINPAVTIGLAVAGEFPWSSVGGFVAAQMAGGIVGGAIVYLFYKSHYDITEDAGLKLATFCNAPAVRNFPLNFLCEAIATFVLVYAVLLTTDPTVILGTAENAREVKVGLGSIGALRVGLIVFAIGLSLGGTTGYAINPARDLGPRIAHAILPIRGKGDSDWSYATIPVIGPIVGGVLAALLYRAHDFLFPII